MRIQGAKEYAAYMKKFQAKLDGKSGGDILRQGVAKALMVVKGESQANYLTGPRPQRLGVVTGRLRSSLLVDTERDGHTVRGTMGTDVYYARKHEFGIGVRKRPFLGPAMKAKSRQVRTIVNDAFERCLRG